MRPALLSTILLYLACSGLCWTLPSIKQDARRPGDVGQQAATRELLHHSDALAAFEATPTPAGDSDLTTSTLANRADQGILSNPADAPAEVPSTPSCFFLALSSLPSTSPCEVLGQSDSYRSETAVKMALCEIGTIENGRAPRECTEWSDKRGKVGLCVEALSRSPQFWASYSGYLREIGQSFRLSKLDHMTSS
ncbi:hypothetical protein JCM11491_002567 [Sporobolomyces phaffii]